MRIGCRFCGAALFLALLPSPAAAQEDGVFVDPDSPAGKEYAIPIDQARRQAAGNPSADGARDSQSAPLFGAGVSPERGAGGQGEGGGEAAGGGNGSSAGDSSRGRNGGAVATGRSALTASTGDGSSATLQTAGMAGGVLLLGGLLALVLRRLNRGQAD